MTFREKLYTADDWWELSHQPENAHKQLELINGEMIDVPAPSPIHAYIADEIFAALRQHVKQHHLGYAFSDSVSYTLSNHDVLIPDASYVSKSRQPTLPDRFTIAPDLAVEVVSPSNRPRELLDKVETYLQHGTQVVWVVYPDERVVDVYKLSDDGTLNLRKIDHDAILDGNSVLPDFSLNIQDIFPND